ncbi:acyl-CoA dehydrogenase [Fulvitalea axinellae]|uniref:Acyl-CoA dehydrogenase n=1 Tax=Fulvitalea axinellae TaxID=1182444 RepID=A0AAU9CMH7_9BACT|nr:acyl-CoA dehydrogenase [Fulvitalea axinellae]
MIPYTQEHRMLQDSLRDFLNKEVVPNIDRWEKEKTCPAQLFKMMGDQGYIGVNYPSEYGGSEMDFWSAVIVMGELSYINFGGFTGSFYAHTYLPLPLINALGTEKQKQNYLKPALLGDKIAGLAITEPGAGSDVAGLKTKAEDKGDHYLVNGSKTFITNGTIGDFVVLVTRTGPKHDMTLLLVDLASSGITKNPITDKLGWHSSDTSQLFFDNVKVPKENVLGEEHKGFYYLMNNIQEERLLMAVMASYAARFAYDKTLRYVKEREAFGKRLSDLQALRHKIADMATKLEACEAITGTAIREFIENGSAATNRITKAKIYTAETAMEIINDAIQLHGGVGYIEEFGLARVWRDVRLFSIGAGSSEIMREIIGKFEIDGVVHEKLYINSRGGVNLSA